MGKMRLRKIAGLAGCRGCGKGCAYFGLFDTNGRNTERPGNVKPIGDLGHKALNIKYSTGTERAKTHSLFTRIYASVPNKPTSKEAATSWTK